MRSLTRAPRWRGVFETYLDALFRDRESLPALTTVRDFIGPRRLSRRRCNRRLPYGFDLLTENVLPALQRLGGFLTETVVPALGRMAQFVQDNMDFFGPFAVAILAIVAA
jgi:hypothetical protein